MKLGNKKSILIAASVCTLGAALLFALKWVKFYLFSVTVWQVADLFDNMSKWDMGSYATYSWLIKGGAILSIVLLVVDTYRITKPLFDGMDDVESARSACIGHIVSIIYAIAFCIFALSVNDGDFEGATITAWPIINIVLNIAARLLLGNLQDDTTKPTYHEKSNNNPAGSTSPLRNPQDIVIPVFNYSSDCDLQPCQLVYSSKSRKTALLIACYANPSDIQSIKFSLSLFDDSKNVFECGTYICDSFQTFYENSITYMMTKAFDVPQFSKIENNPFKARIIIKQIESIGNRIALPITYRSSGLSLGELKRIKEDAKDGVRKKEILGNGWLCVCGKNNKTQDANCIRCRRPKSIRPVFTTNASDNGTWNCVCGTVGVSGNFCSNCGAKRPDNRMWDCICGQKGNTGNFCSNCGRHK